MSNLEQTNKSIIQQVSSSVQQELHVSKILRDDSHMVTEWTWKDNPFYVEKKVLLEALEEVNSGSVPVRTASLQLNRETHELIVADGG